MGVLSSLQGDLAMAATTQHEANLLRLLGAIRTLPVLTAAGETATAKRALCARIAQQLPLSHSDSYEDFERICATGQLLSTTAVAKLTGRAPDPKAPSAEYVLGTEDAVFFYVGPFRYPNTHCGILFSAQLELDNASNATATPFDSGGLVSYYPPPPPGTPRSFFEQHQLPATRHREYLAEVLARLFTEPAHYVRRVPPTASGPVPLASATADARIWTFEVRIKGAVGIRVRTHLDAVFTPTEVEPATEEFLGWCSLQGVAIVSIEVPLGTEGAGFELLRVKSEQYIERRLAGGTGL
jgi:hypothetical protein